MPDKGKNEEKEKKEENKEENQKAEEKPKLTPRQQLSKDLYESVIILTSAVENRERRLQARALGRMTSIRKRIPVSVLRKFATEFNAESVKYLQCVMDEEPDEDEKDDNKMDTSEGENDSNNESSAKTTEVVYSTEEKKLLKAAPALHEVQLFVHLLVAQFLGDKGHKNETVSCMADLLKFLHSQNRRTADMISAKVYQYYSLAFERVGKLVDIRSDLLKFHRTACLVHNEPAQTTLATCILRNYLSSNLVNQADGFRSQIRFPENCSNNQHARYLYYIGRIESVRLAYSKAFNALSQAIRKCSERKETVGFRQAAYKLLIIVQLLMGEIPERSLFFQPDLQTALKPYFHLTRAVRVGDLGAFSRVMTPINKEHFIKDNTYSLIIRLRHNVIKTGLRKINLSYSKISMVDICQKLKLETEEDAEYIVAKAIHDGVVDAVLDRKAHVMISKPFVDVYVTREPAIEFHKRIEFCLNTRNEAVKAMRYPPNAHKTQAELDAEEAERNKEIKEAVLDADQMDE